MKVHSIGSYSDRLQGTLRFTHGLSYLTGCVMQVFLGTEIHFGYNIRLGRFLSTITELSGNHHVRRCYY